MEQTAFDLADTPTCSVAELAAGIRGALRNAFPGELWVRGEVQGLTRSRLGHTYFTLVEKERGANRVRAAVEVVLFRDSRQSVELTLAAFPGADLTSDVEVRIRARVDHYAGTGRLQLVMSAIDPAFTLGRLAATRERVLRLLAGEGLLERNGALALPLVPLRVGLVTSRGSAAYHDVVDELGRSPFAWEVVLADARVQGTGAPAAIATAITRLARAGVDVVVVARGGGSRTDLAPFDTEVVARAVATSPVPVLAGIGHETDRSVVDEVAHTACKTPTACAQLLVGRVRDFVVSLDGVAGAVSSRARARGALARRELDELGRRVRVCIPSVLGREGFRLATAAVRADELGRRATARASERLDRAGTRAHGAAVRQLERASLRLDTADATARATDPRRVLERGYSLTRDRHGRVLRRAGDAAVDQVVTTQLADGALTSVVTAVTTVTGDGPAGIGEDEQ